MQQRERTAQQSVEERALRDAGNADRAAKRQMKRRLQDGGAYKQLSEVDQAMMMETAVERLEQERFENQQSRMFSIITVNNNSANDC